MLDRDSNQPLHLRLQGRDRKGVRSHLVTPFYEEALDLGETYPPLPDAVVKFVDSLADHLGTKQSSPSRTGDLANCDPGNRRGHLDGAAHEARSSGPGPSPSCPSST